MEYTGPANGWRTKHQCLNRGCRGLETTRCASMDWSGEPWVSLVTGGMMCRWGRTK